MGKKVWIIFMLLILWAWGNDADITTSQYMPESYQLFAVNTDTIFMIYRYKTAPDTTYETVMRSTDSGKTWGFYTGLYLPGQLCDYRECDITYFNDTLFVIFPQQHSVAFARFSDSIHYSQPNTSYTYTLDTAFNIKTEIVRYGGDIYFYTAAVSKKGDTTKLVVTRSIDHAGTWETVIERPITTVNSIHMKLLDFDAFALSSDSLKLVPTYSYYDENSNTYAVYSEIWGDTLGPEAYIIHGMAILKITDSNHESACDIMNNMTVWAIKDSGKLFFAYTTDDLNSLNTIEYPYNTDYVELNGIDMVSWSTFLASGFNLSYAGTTTGNINVYFEEITISAGALSFSEPILVSDSGYSSYIFNFSPYVKPRIRNIADISIPYIVWNNDYSHLSGSPPILFFDSTTYRIDGMAISSSVNEQKRKPVVPLKLYASGNTLDISLPQENRKFNVSIIDISGRTVLKRVLQFNNGSATIDITTLKSGVYLISLKNASGKFKGKFVKIE